MYFNSLGRILTIRATLLEKNAKISTVLIKEKQLYVLRRLKRKIGGALKISWVSVDGKQYYNITAARFTG